MPSISYNSLQRAQTTIEVGWVEAILFNPIPPTLSLFSLSPPLSPLSPSHMAIDPNLKLKFRSFPFSLSFEVKILLSNLTWCGLFGMVVCGNVVCRRISRRRIFFFMGYNRWYNVMWCDSILIRHQRKRGGEKGREGKGEREKRNKERNLWILCSRIFSNLCQSWFLLRSHTYTALRTLILSTHHSSLITHHSSLITHQSLTTHHSPLTAHRSPLTAHHFTTSPLHHFTTSPLTTHHSPLTTHHSPLIQKAKIYQMDEENEKVRQGTNDMKEKGNLKK